MLIKNTRPALSSTPKGPPQHNRIECIHFPLFWRISFWYRNIDGSDILWKKTLILILWNNFTSHPWVWHPQCTNIISTVYNCTGRREYFHQRLHRHGSPQRPPIWKRIPKLNEKSDIIRKSTPTCHPRLLSKRSSLRQNCSLSILWTCTRSGLPQCRRRSLEQSFQQMKTCKPVFPVGGPVVELFLSSIIDREFPTSSGTSWAVLHSFNHFVAYYYFWLLTFYALFQFLWLYWDSSHLIEPVIEHRTETGVDLWAILGLLIPVAAKQVAEGFHVPTEALPQNIFTDVCAVVGAQDQQEAVFEAFWWSFTSFWWNISTLWQQHSLHPVQENQFLFKGFTSQVYLLSEQPLSWWERTTLQMFPSS